MIFMMQEDYCERIIQKYYKQIYQFCYSHLNYSKEGAEDCTQEIFMILLQKKNKLNLTENMRAWLYITAYGVMRNYRRRESKYVLMENIDDLPLSDDGGIEAVVMQDERRLDFLTNREQALMTDYYTAEHGQKRAIAKKYNMSLPALYNEVSRIKKKIRRHIPKDHPGEAAHMQDDEKRGD